MRIIPAIDIIEGKAVRLSQGDYHRKKVYNEDPLEVAMAFEDAGLQYLHMVDLDGAKAGNIINWSVLEKIASKTRLMIDFGGGVKSDEDLRIAFDSGAKQITGGSIAIREPQIFETWIREYGAEKIILGADARKGKIAVQGWTETTETTIHQFISDYVQKGIKYTICTDIEKDGMLQGPAAGLYQDILEQVPEVRLIASGGVGSLQDLETLQELSIEGVIIGKALYEGKIQLSELSKFSSENA
jgi:phosphoribosylformimino-5-aminoimidazole carboxamide ribotide isomerase